MAKTQRQGAYGRRVSIRPDRPALGQVGEHKRVAVRHREVTRKAMELLGAMRFLDLSPEAMRKPAFPGQTVLGDRGENLPSVLENICADQQRRDALAEWLRELTPVDVRGFAFPRDETTGQVHLVIKEGAGHRASAYSASDGSLRLAFFLRFRSPLRLGACTVLRRRLAWKYAPSDGGIAGTSLRVSGRDASPAEGLHGSTPPATGTCPNFPARQRSRKLPWLKACMEVRPQR